MVSILPSERSPWDIIGRDTGKALQQVLPGAVQQGFQRQQGLTAIDQLQDALGKSGGDINQILPALARAYTLNPGLERSGLGQQYLQQARVGNAYGMQPQTAGQTQTEIQPSITGQQNQSQTQPEQKKFATPGPFNIMTKDDMDAESKRFAIKTGDPNNYNTRFNQLQGQNDAATSQRQALETAALNADVKPGDLSRFMVVNSHLDPRNPAEWAQDGIRNFARVKANDTKIQNAFIPGLGNALIGQNRDEDLKNLIPTLQENKKMGLEQEDRNYLADNYVTPTEIESLYHPLTPKHEKSLSKLPEGPFVARTGEELSYFYNPKKQEEVSYEEMLERNPEKLSVMQNDLTNFFMKNVDKDTSLLNLRENLWEKKGYDWRQMGPAIREAEKQGLELTPEQQREMTTLETQPPIQSLSDIFKSFDRVIKFFRGNR